jgi:hypothetical protein
VSFETLAFELLPSGDGNAFAATVPAGFVMMASYLVRRNMRRAVR